jgi:CelD/BcsL family acetyltransferase involved in cellulose biosynthesis
MSTTPLVAFVKVDGVPVAASVNLVGRRSVEGCVTTYDEAFGRYSVGTLMLDFLARWSHASGRDFDMRPLFADYKARWANRETRHKTLFVFLSARGRLMEISFLATILKGLARRGTQGAKAIVFFSRMPRHVSAYPTSAMKKLVTSKKPRLVMHNRRHSSCDIDHSMTANH